jgi:ribosomal protein S27AE
MPCDCCGVNLTSLDALLSHLKRHRKQIQSLEDVVVNIALSRNPIVDQAVTEKIDKRAKATHTCHRCGQKLANSTALHRHAWKRMTSPVCETDLGTELIRPDLEWKRVCPKCSAKHNTASRYILHKCGNEEKPDRAKQQVREDYVSKELGMTRRPIRATEATNAIEATEAAEVMEMENGSDAGIQDQEPSHPNDLEQCTLWQSQYLNPEILYEFNIPSTSV